MLVLFLHSIVLVLPHVLVLFLHSFVLMLLVYIISLCLQCMLSLQSSHLPEAAEILDILNQIEFEGLFYSHDKLAQLQVGFPLVGGKATSHRRKG